jgi:hypothetical protein
VPCSSGTSRAERPYTTKTLKTIRQKQDESLRDYVKHFCNARNDIPYIQNIEIINAFRDGVDEIKIVEEIAIKKPKTVVDLLTVTNVCIEASEARDRLLKSQGKGPQGSRKIVRSTQLTKETADTAASSPRVRWRRGLFGVPMT